MDDLISRQQAIDALREAESHAFNAFYKGLVKAHKIIVDLPSAQPERLTDDDFETIRIHLSAFKESLCNQYRWKEANEYQQLIDRFMSFASAQQETCEGCKHLGKWEFEVEYGYSSPCTRCKRRGVDHYER